AGPEGRCQSRGWIGGRGKARRRGIVGAIPRRSNAASVAEPPPNLVTDFGFGTLATPGPLSRGHRAAPHSRRRAAAGFPPAAAPPARAAPPCSPRRDR